MQKPPSEALVRLRLRLRDAESSANDARAALQARKVADSAVATEESHLRSARRSIEMAKDAAERAKKIVYPLSRLLTDSGFGSVVPIARARVPVVKCISPQGVHCDIVVNNGLATYNTALLRTYALACPCFRSLAILVKAWARALAAARAQARARAREPSRASLARRRRRRAGGGRSTARARRGSAAAAAAAPPPRACVGRGGRRA